MAIVTFEPPRGVLEPFEGKLFTAQTYKSTDFAGPAPLEVSIPQAIVDIITCKFLVYGDTAKQIREQIQQEQVNVGLVSALFLTISIPLLVSTPSFAQQGWTDWQMSVWGLSLCLATANFSAAVILAVFFSLGIQECCDDAELRRFTSLMGRYLQLSSVSFVAGVLILGGFSWTFWCYVTFQLGWFLIFSLGCIGLNAFIFAFTGLVIMIKKLYAAKEHRSGLLIMSREETLQALNAYLHTLLHPDLADIGSMKEFVLSQTHCSYLSDQSSKRLHAEWEQAIVQYSKHIVDENLRLVNNVSPLNMILEV